jgi:hypothetical protein
MGAARRRPPRHQAASLTGASASVASAFGLRMTISASFSGKKSSFTRKPRPSPCGQTAPMVLQEMIEKGSVTAIKVDSLVAESDLKDRLVMQLGLR